MTDEANTNAEASGTVAVHSVAALEAARAAYESHVAEHSGGAPQPGWELLSSKEQDNWLNHVYSQRAEADNPPPKERAPRKRRAASTGAVPRGMMRVDEVAAFLEVASSTVYRLVRESGFPESIKVPGLGTFWVQAEVEHWHATRAEGKAVDAGTPMVELVAALHVAGARGFHLSTANGQESKYERVTRFRTLEDLQAFDAAFVAVMLAAQHE